MRKHFIASLTTGLTVLLAVYWFTNPSQAAGPQLDRAAAQQKGLAELARYAQDKGYAGLDQARVMKVEIDDLGMGHTRVQQTVNGVPVWGGEAIIHLKSDGSLFAVTDSLQTDVSVDTNPNLSARDAIENAKARYYGSLYLTAEPTADLWVWRGKKRDYLAYRVQMRREDGSAETAMPVYFIDAQTGAKLWEYDNLQTQSATGSGVSLYSGTVSLTTFQSSACRTCASNFFLEDVGRKLGTFNYGNGDSSASRFSDADNLWNSTVQQAGVDAHFGAAATFNYYQTVHQRNGIDGNGGPGYTTSVDGVTPLITSRVHYSTNYNNAFWNGSYMTYGDGDGSRFSPLTTLDITGHEMTHGVTERTAGLIYDGESGALNESMSDVFGAMVERFVRGESANTWKIGEEAFTPATAGDALRNLDDPHLAGDPDHYSERYIGTDDHGGVHTNSGIANKAFFLTAKGGTHHLSGVTVTGIGANATALIWYRALTSYMTSSANFAGARTATLSAATAIYGFDSTPYRTVATAWCAVGVGSCPPPPTPYNLVGNGGFENGLSPWALFGTGVSRVGGNSHTGNVHAQFGGAVNVYGGIYQQISIPHNATKTDLTFWFHVNSAEPLGTQNDKLFVEVRDTNGTLLSTLATFNNAKSSGGIVIYTQRGPFSLLAYRGRTIRLQFRTANNDSLVTTFRVDDVTVTTDGASDVIIASPT
jgi:thermolysin